MKQVVLKYVLQNILKYGKVNKKAVLGKIFSEQPSLKENRNAVFDELAAAIKEVSGWDKKKQEHTFKKYVSSIKTKKKERIGLQEFKELPELPKVDRDYVFRIEIGPSGLLHVGHIVTILLNAEYAKKYKGKFILRLSDTNPDAIDPKAYAAIVADTKWLTDDAIDEVIVQSDKMGIYYMYAKQLIHMGKAYVCTCSAEFFRKESLKKEPCPCRNQAQKETERRWRKMFLEYQQGEAILRIKTDLRHKNPAVRDWPAFRINETEHPRQGKRYRVWPLMNFSVAIDDHESAMTHVIRGKDHVVNKELQHYLFTYLDWWVPHYIHIGRINFTNMRLKTSLTKEEIKKGNFSGWDDVRLPFLGAFRRRGILPAAFMKYVHEIGPSRVDKTVPYESFMQAIYSYNKEFVDAYAKRYFFVEKPKQVIIKDAPNLEVEMPLHPDYPKKGSRHFATGQTFYVADTLEKHKLYRFMHLFNFKSKTFQGEAYDSSLGAHLIHWLPVNDGLVKVHVVMPDGSIKKGLGEQALQQVKVHDIVQFERFGFCRLDEKRKDTLVFCYGHR